ncbi:MAG: hypothetical protein ACE5MK_02990, partial [Acidobacteriota bacterium]
MEKHITILGSLYVAWGALGALAALCLAAVLISGEFIPLETTTICYVVAGCIALLSTLEIVGGVALLQRRSWARILVLVLGFLNLICIPIGTALGIYTIWVLMKDETA